MQKKIFLMMLGLFIIFTIIFVGCVNKDEVYVFSQYDKEAITSAIKQSNMLDHGFRFATAEYKKYKSSYATFYITSAKSIVNQMERTNKINQAEQLALLDTTLSTSVLDLTDIYCAVSLVEDKNSISESQKKVIENYLQSLYLAEIGCYSMPNIQNNAKKELYIYPTFLAHKIASSLDIKLESIESYLENISKDLFEDGVLSRDNSGTYSLLIQLLKEYKINIPTSYVESIISMFEKDLDSIDSLTNGEDVYLPVYFLDYKEISYILGYDNPYYNQIIIDSLCDENGIKSGIISPYDSYGLYAVMRTLELANLEFESLALVDVIFEDFDAFLLGDGIYIAPGKTTSNFVDTYYVDSIISHLNIDIENEISVYCSTKQKEIVESGIINTYYFLELLERNDLLNTTITNKQEFATQFETVLNQLFAESIIEQQYLPNINAAIKSTKILGGSYDIDDDIIQKIIANFTNNSNIQQSVYDLCKLIDFLVSVYSGENEMLSKYCIELEKKLINLSSLSCSNKLMLFYEAFNLFSKCDYQVSITLKDVTNKLLFYSQSNYGLYKGGDSNEDIESFRNTYYGIVLTDIMNQFEKE